MTDVIVTQEDREAARKWDFIECCHCSQYDGNFVEDLAEDFARHRQSSTEEAERPSGEPPEIVYEVWEDDLLVASSTSKKEARHYHAVYSQDGPVHLVKATIYRTALTGASTHD